MKNITTDPKNRKVYGSVAVTATGNAFGVVKQNDFLNKIENWQLQNHLVDWKLIGDIDMGHK